MISKNILLTGSTGFLGYRILEVLPDLPAIDSVLANGRRFRSGLIVSHPKVNYILGDLSDASFANKIVKGCDTIIHCAALSSPWGSLKAFRKANLQTQENLIDAAIRYGIKRYVFISTPSIYFNYKNRFNIREDEALPGKFVNHYAATKRQAEILLEKSGLSYITLRPRAIIGRGDQTIIPRMIRAYHAGRLKIVGDGKNIVDLTSVANVVDAVVLSIQANGEALNKVYNITNGKPVYLWKTMAKALDKLNLEMPQKKISFRTAFFAASIMELWAKISLKKEEPVITKYSIGILAKSMTMDISKACKLLAYRPQISTEKAIDEFVNWYNQHEAN